MTKVFFKRFPAPSSIHSMNLLNRLWWPALLLLVFSQTSPADSETIHAAHTQLTLISEDLSLQAGSQQWLGLRMQMDPQWHVYWKNPGDSGLPPTIKWELPSFLEAGPIEWPSPQKISQPPLMSYGYENDLFLLIPINVSASIPADSPAMIKANVDWLACQVQCIPGKAELSLQLPVKNSIPVKNSPAEELFAANRQKLPQKAVGWQIAAEDDGREVQLKLVPPQNQQEQKEYYFFPERSDLFEHAQEQTLKKTGKGDILSLPRSSLVTGTIQEVSGVLVYREESQGHGLEKAIALTVPVKTPVAQKSQMRVLYPFGLTHALIFAFLGGLILNLMPCVFPVLSIKILSLIEQAKKQGTPGWSHGFFLRAGSSFHSGCWISGYSSLKRLAVRWDGDFNFNPRSSSCSWLVCFS